MIFDEYATRRTPCRRRAADRGTVSLGPCQRRGSRDLAGVLRVYERLKLEGALGLA